MSLIAAGPKSSLDTTRIASQLSELLGLEVKLLVRVEAPAQGRSGTVHKGDFCDPYGHPQTVILKKVAPPFQVYLACCRSAWLDS